MVWQPGQSGNPAGRRPGASASALRAKLEEGAPDVAKKVLALAKAGDLAAARLVLERVLPALRPEALPVVFALDRDASLTDQGRQLLAAAAAGQLTPDVASELIAALGRLAGLRQVEEMEARIRQLEEQLLAQYV